MKYLYPWCPAFVALVASFLPAGAFAQSQMEVITPGGVLPVPVAGPMEPADRLAMNLRLLAQNPYDVTALTQAGESALAVGDANAAISFLARAEELSPANGRIKADLARALVQLERPAEAFRLFGEATTLGVPLQSIVKDRGLAFDLRGDPKRAQQDYAYALRASPDDETVRRYALSLGISGEKDQALRQLEPLLRKRDQAAWRARAFILAMNNDQRGAEKIAEQVVPVGMMSGFATFMRRLPSLTAAERAAAVNFGTIPSQDVRLASVQTVADFRPIDQSTADVLTPRPVVVPAAVVTPPRDRRSRGKPVQVATRDASLTSTPAPVLEPASARVAEPVQPVPPTQPTPSWNENRMTRRVGERIGPVDPARLPPELAPSPAKPPQAVATRPVLQQGVTALPLPDALAAREAVPKPAPVIMPPAPQVIAAAPAPAPVTPKPPLFEVPKAASPAPQVAIAPPLPTIPAPAPALAMPAPSPVVPATPKPAEVAAAAPVLRAPTPVGPPPASQPIAPPLLTPAPAPVAVAAAPAAPVLPKVIPELPAAPKAAPAPGFSELVVTKPVVAVAPAPAPVATPAPAPVEVASAVPPTLTPVPAKPIEPVSPATVAAGPTLADAGLTRPPPIPVAMETVAAASAPNTPPVPATPTPALPPPSKPVQAGLGGLLADVAPEEESRAGPMMTDTEFRRARLAAKRKAAAELRDDEAEAEKTKLAATEKTRLAAEKAREEEERKAIAARNPERVWVQVATGARKDGLPVTMKKLREQAPDALKGVGSATIPFRATNRLLVGPFKSQAEARAMINKLAKQGIQANSFTSEAGEEVTRLSSRG